jgi:hypothetical protein
LEEAMNKLTVFMQRFWSIGVLTVLAALVLGLDAPQAYASATGAEPVSAFKLNLGYGGVGTDVPIPAGLLTHRIQGDGRRIASEFAAYQITPSLIGLLKGKVCNWQIDFSYKENGKEYLRERGKPVPQCDGIVKPISAQAKPKTVRYGQACAELWVNGKFRAAQCHNILR